MLPRLAPILLGGLLVALTAASCGGSSSSSTAGAPTTSTGAASTASTAALPFVAKLRAPTRTPATKTRWYYVVTVADRSGAPIKATITVEVVDPLQQAHPVAYDGTKQNITNRPIGGKFRDYVIWPATARGITLTLRVTVKAMGAVDKLAYAVTPK